MIVFYNLPNRLERKHLTDWLSELALIYEVSIKSLAYNYVTEAALLDLNQTFLQHDTLTDIITFAYVSNPVEAEIYIGTVRMEENAKLYNQPIEIEMLRLIAHGFLHCIGYKDKTEAEKSLMRKQEERCIELFHVKHKKNV